MHPLFVLDIRVMNKDYENSFADIMLLEPPKGLYEKIIQRIRYEQNLQLLRRKFIFFSILLVGSVTVFIPTFKAVQTSLHESGFSYFISLIFSDFDIIIGYWQDFVMLLLGVLPAMSLVVLFTAIFAFLASIKFLARNTKLLYIKKLTINI